ncbi:MAG: hypothetical protein CMI55_03965 [Parcubacteria group bacterium]|nr:hypothetical protein [Parcubacteria group bacterium]
MTTEPTWSDAKHGWYNGNDRVIFAIYTNGSSQVTEFFHGGDTVMWADEIQNQASVDIDTTFTDINALIIPKFATVGIVAIDDLLHGGVFWWWRTNGQSGSTGHQVGDALTHYSVLEVITDSNQIIELKASGDNIDTVSCDTHGWKFPAGI